MCISDPNLQQRNQRILHVKYTGLAAGRWIIGHHIPADVSEAGSDALCDRGLRGAKTPHAVVVGLAVSI